MIGQGNLGLLILAEFKITADVLCLRGIITAGVVSIVCFVCPRCIVIYFVIILGIVEFEYRWCLLLAACFGDPPCRVRKDGFTTLRFEAWTRCARL